MSVIKEKIDEWEYTDPSWCKYEREKYDTDIFCLEEISESFVLEKSNDRARKFVKELENRSAHGDISATIELAWIYISGYDIDNIEHGIELTRQIINNESPIETKESDVDLDKRILTAKASLASILWGKWYYEDAVNLMKQLEHYDNYDGSDNILCHLGDAYLIGRGVERDYNTAISYYMRSAQLENSEAMVKLAMFYKTNIFIKQDLDKYKQWITKAAELGNSNAREELNLR